MSFQLSPRAKELIPKARIVSFATWSAYPAEIIALLQAADDAGRYLSDTDLAALAATGIPAAENLAAAKLLRDRAAEIVTEARERVLADFPGIAEPGGDLYPAPRAEACWRDFWHFLRCVTYGIAGGKAEFTSPEGLHYMDLLYQELRVPLAAMVAGLLALERSSLQRLKNMEDSAAYSPYFARLIESLRTFER